MRVDQTGELRDECYVVNCLVDGQGGGDDDQDGQEESQAEHEDVVAEVRLEFPRGSTAEGLKVDI